MPDIRPTMARARAAMAAVRRRCLRLSGAAAWRWLARAVLLAMSLALAVASGADARDRPPFAAAVDRAIGGAIVPGYKALVAAAVAQRAAMERLCLAPSADALAQARAAFAGLVGAFSRVEPYRFGPAREDNRFERLFFWPDPRGRGLRQVEALLSAEDPAATDPGSLRGKSVAVQGLPALDIVLSGAGSDGLAVPAGGFRCRYGAAVAAAVETTAGEILAGWTAPDGFGSLMRRAGPDNPVYRSHGEAVAHLLQAGAEQLGVVADLKLAPVLGDDPASARPRLAPFRRSDLPLVAIAGNLEGVATLASALDLPALLPPADRGLASELSFELRQALAPIAALSGDGRPLEAILADPGSHARLAYATAPVGGARALLATRIPAALGLVSGFNSLDGD